MSGQAALGRVAGYVLGNDVSERAWQRERGGTWDKSKSLSFSGPATWCGWMLTDWASSARSAW